MRVHRYIALFLFSAALVWGVQAHAALIDSQMDDSAQSTRPAFSNGVYLPNVYHAMGYIPSRDYNLAGVRLRVNTSGGGNYLCPTGGIYSYLSTSTPTLWSNGTIVGDIISVATTTPDADGNCDYVTRDRFGKMSPLPIFRSRYHIFFMATGGSTSKWVSISGKPLSSTTSQDFFGYRDAFSNPYVWGTTGLEAPYFETFDTPPPPSVPPMPPDPCATPNSCASNVLFLPGIEASRLYRPDGAGGEKKLWEPGLNDLLRDLYLTPEGKSLRNDVYAKEDDVVDEVPATGANIYKSFIAKMDELRDVKKLINDWEAIPYDWRLSLDDILASGKQTGMQISYLDATSTPFVVQELKRLAASSKTHKVTVVAHSNGGLVAKRLTQLLGTEAATLIDKMIFVAVPQAGTPAAVAVALHGYGQNFGFGPVVSVSQATARTFASTSPMTYHLLPSASYFTQVDAPIISFAPSLPDWITRYGATIHSAEGLRTFLTDSYGRVDAQTGSIDAPIQAHGALLASAEAVHANLDTWTPPVGVELIQIAGWGVPTTVTGLTYKKKEKGTGVKPEPAFTIDGDGTVVVPSALWTSSASTTRYWMDLGKYNKRIQNQVALGLLSTKHADILEVPGLLDFLSDRITNITRSLSDYTYLSAEAPPSTDIRLRYALHSPLTLSLYDSEGKHTGVSTTTGQVEMQVPGTYYTEFGDVKYLFSDAIGARVIMEGYDTGTFTFAVEEYNGDTLTASTTFKDIPTAALTNVALDIQSDLTTLSPMRLDKDGDGVVDATLAPKLNDTVTLDTTPPEIRVSFDTTLKALSFIGTDESGTAVVTTSTDFPELKKNQKEPHGTATTTVTARDEAGNTTVLVYTEKLPSPKERDTVTLWSLAYNDSVTKIASTTLAYKWRNKKDGSYQVLASHLRTISTALESHYRPKKDVTAIMTKPRDLDDSDSDDDSDTRPVKQSLPGIVIPYLMTEKGSLIISY